MDSVDVHDAEGRFVLGRVALGGRYRLLAVDNDSEARALSEIVAIDEQHPLEEVALRFVEGVTLAGQVLDPDGAAAAGASLVFEYSSPHGQSFGGQAKMADADGRFRFEHVDPRLPGRYSLTVLPGENLCGASLSIDDPTQPLTIELDRGQKLKGVLIDAATSRPMGDTEVTALLASAYANYSRARYRGLIRTTTDSRGRFEFRNLETLRYRLLVDGAGKVQIVAADGESQVRDGEAVAEAGQEGWLIVKATLAASPSR